MPGQQQGLLAAIQGSNSLFDLGQTAYHTYKAGEALTKGAQGIRNQTAKYGDLQLQQQEPWYQAGTKAMSELSAQNAAGQFNVDPYNYKINDFNYQQSPGYQFAKQQGENSIRGSSAARGGLLSGTTMKALQKYGIGLAAQDYNNMFDQYYRQNQLGMQNATNIYQSQNQQSENAFERGMQISGAGQQAANQRTNTYNWMGNNMIDADVAQANAKAGTYMGISRAWSTNFNNQSQIAGNVLGGGGGLGGGQMGNDFSGGMGGSANT